MNSLLRPDEAATQAEIERSEQRNLNLGRGLKTAATIGAAVVGAPLAARVLPLLNQFIPAELARKGINKISPQLGKFIDKGMKEGLSLQSGLDFLKEQFSEKEQTKDARNIIQQYSPELFQFIDQEIKNGRSPIEAGAIAQNDKRFTSAIKKLTQDHKTPWSNILESVFGAQEQSQVQQMPQQPSQEVPQQQIPHPNSAQGKQLARQQPQQGQQGSGVSAELMQALQMAAESRKRRQQ